MSRSVLIAPRSAVRPRFSRLSSSRPSSPISMFISSIAIYVPTGGVRSSTRRPVRWASCSFASRRMKSRWLTTSDGGKEKLRVTVRDHILGIPVQLHVDYLNLATAIPQGFEELSQVFKVPLNHDGFFMEAHMKLRPVDFATDGVFVAAWRVIPNPSKNPSRRLRPRPRGPPWHWHDPTWKHRRSSRWWIRTCASVAVCVKPPVHLGRFEPGLGKGYRAETIAASCKGCGVCSASCPQQAIDMMHFRGRQLVAAIRAGGARQ